MKILVTAGPTREPLDPARFLSNRSSGKMGYALAEAALRRGHSVTLVSGPVGLTPPKGAEVARVTTTEEMKQAVESRLEAAEALIMAAAPADWRPKRTSAHKLKKDAMPAALELEKTPDILAGAAQRKGKRVFVGFAAETENMEAEARRKLRAKGLDIIAANDISNPNAGFEADTNRMTLFFQDGTREEIPLMSKDEAAERIIDAVERVRSRAGPAA